ncbi:hypothetical protein H7F33_12315 [Pedobacter sp. PAMC26386]|nr:hypothetical protein H7F33_12315 [Pedobacter sp. PAMC26386]
MKTSTMFIIIAVLITLGSLVAFNSSLKDYYLTGAYKSRFNGMNFKSLSGVEKLSIKTAKLSEIQLEYGDKEGIWIDKDIETLVKYGVNGQTLNLGVSTVGKDSRSGVINGRIIIVTKKLNAILTAPFFVPEKGEYNYNGSSNISVKGYNLAQLDLQIAGFVSIYLHRMDIQRLNANVGTKTEGGAELTLASDTKIGHAELNVPGNSKLNLLNPQLVKTNYNLSDSATVSLNGKIVQMIR